MNYRFGALLITGLLVMTCGCTPTQSSSNNTLGAYEFVFQFDLGDVKAKNEAAAYAADWASFDTNTIMGAFLKYDVSATDTYAEGLFYETSAENGEYEYLTVFDGGASLEMNSGVNGGFSYTLHGDTFKTLYDYSTLFSLFPGYSDDIYSNSLMARMPQNKELDFMTIDVATAFVLEQGEACGLPEIAVERVYSFDVKTLQGYQQEYDRSRGEDYSVEEAEWTKEDEAYLIHFRQVVDDIPVINVSWGVSALSDADEEKQQLCAVGHALVTSQGIISYYISHATAPDKETDRGTLTSPEAAVEIIKSTYDKVVLISDITVYSLELVHVGASQNDRIVLTPAWIFTLSQEIETEEVTHTQYEYFVVNAFTGEQIATAGDIL